MKIAPKAVPPADGAPAPTAKGFIAFEPMVAITNALNLAHTGVYKDLQSIPSAESPSRRIAKNSASLFRRPGVPASRR